MSESLTISEDEYNFELTRSFELGIGSGWESAGKLLLEKATEYFKRKDDKTAELLRSLSEEIIKKGTGLADAARKKEMEK